MTAYHLKRAIFSGLMLTSAPLALGASAAFAQTTDTAAEDASANGGEIVVTARRREETLQDVPIAVSAFSGEMLAEQGAPDITALQQQTPNLTL